MLFLRAFVFFLPLSLGVGAAHLPGTCLASSLHFGLNTTGHSPRDAPFDPAFKRPTPPALSSLRTVLCLITVVSDSLGHRGR